MGDNAEIPDQAMGMQENILIFLEVESLELLELTELEKQHFFV